MSIARQIADMIDSGGDVRSGVLDNVPVKDWATMQNKPAHADIDMTNASNLASGTMPTARLGSGTADTSTMLRGDGTWVTNCTNFANCTSAPSSGTIQNSSGSYVACGSRGTGGTGTLSISVSGSTMTLIKTG
jgi:hypothetical protein